MNSIRSLATVTILAIVGVGLYVVINSSEPVPPDEAVDATLEIPEIEDELAGLVDDVGAETYANSDSVPSFDGSTMGAPPPAWSPPGGETAPPALPDDSAVSTAPAHAETSVAEALPHSAVESLQQDGTSPSTGRKNPFSAQLEHQQQAQGPSAPAEDPFAGQPPTTSPPSSALPAPDPHSTLPTVAGLPGAPSGVGSGTAMPFEPTVTPYTVARATIEETLRRGELSQALLMLTEFYGDPQLTPTEQESLQTLLSQLAGTVIYSTDHELEPPYRVQPGDTLEGIAARYSVSGELLAKINGLANPHELTPGRELKVVRGPFHAVYDQHGLRLVLGGRYAGRFDASGPGNWPADSWTVLQKVPESASANTPNGLGKKITLIPANRDPNVTPVAIVSNSGASSDPSQPQVRVSERDMNDLFDILTVGSRVTVRR